MVFGTWLALFHQGICRNWGQEVFFSTWVFTYTSLTWKKVCDVHSGNWLAGMGGGRQRCKACLHDCSTAHPWVTVLADILQNTSAPGTMKSTPPKWNYSISPYRPTVGPYTKAYDLKVTNLDVWVVDIRM